MTSLTASAGLSYQKSVFIYSAIFGRRHREPMARGMVPTRCQSPYNILIILLDVVFLLAPYTLSQKQASFTPRYKQTLGIVGNCVGVVAMGNVVALFLFSSGKSVVLYGKD